jgi:N utilization substance protein B
MSEKEIPAQLSNKMKALSARLLAVQAVHQNLHNKKPAQTLVNEYLKERVGMQVEGEKIAMPDGALFRAIVLGVDERFPELAEIVHAAYSRNEKSRNLESLLLAVMLCASYEIMAHNDIDAPIIINDYLNVTHGFFDKGEVALVNGILDFIAKTLRN